MRDLIRRYGVWILIIVVLAGVLIGTPSIRKEQVLKDAVGEEVLKEEKVTLLSVESYEELYEMLSRSKNAEKQPAYTADGGDMEIEAVMTEDVAAAGSSDMGTQDEAPAVYSVSNAKDDFSGTNTQEENVDEGDIVKNDGNYIYVLDALGNVHIVDGNSMEQVHFIAFDGKEQSKRMEMYVDGDILQVIWQEYDYVSIQASQQEKTRTYYSIPITVTVAATYDITNRTNPVKTGIYRQDGKYLSSRKNGENLYLFTSYTPYGTNGANMREFYVPRAGEAFLGCEEIYFPGQSADGCFGGTSYLVSGSFTNEKPDTPKDCMAVVSGGETFYVSEENIYAAVSQWEDNADYTEIVRMGYHDGYFIAGSSGRIPGRLNNSFSMNEYNGYLRAVVTSEWAVEKKDLFTTEVSMERVNHLYVLNHYLEITGKIENLAEGEEIQSARFMGDTGYFVTYRNTDPLFSVDLSDPENPKILGELKITGFSEYLHFYGKDQLLGIGWETDPDSGRNLGLKCVMFDLGDPGNVQITDKFIVEGVDYCEALDEYKSILVNADNNIFGLAYMMYEEESWEEQYYYGVFTYSREEGLQPFSYILLGDEMAASYEDYRCLRGLYMGKVFYLAGNHGVVSYDMDKDFEKMAEVFW